MELAGRRVPPDRREFGDYQLLARLARGGMAEIYLARESASRSEPYQPLVIKRILPHLAQNAEFVAMLHHEAQLAACLRHPNVCEVRELGCHDGVYFIAMEYLHGLPLSQILSRAAKEKMLLPPELVAGILYQACAGLHYAHELTSATGEPLEMVHRDVSPPNLFVTEDGRVKLLDFGVAKVKGASQLSRTGTVKGKNSYMSPEQIIGHPLDRRSDIFSLGVVLYESLQSARLFARETEFLTFRAILTGEIPDLRTVRPELPAPLCTAVRRSLATTREYRFDDAAEFGEALAAAVGGPEGMAGPEEISAFLRKHFPAELEAIRELCGGTDGMAEGSRELPTVVRHPAPSPAAAAIATGTSDGAPAYAEAEDTTYEPMPAHVLEALAKPAPRGATQVRWPLLILLALVLVGATGWLLASGLMSDFVP